MEQNRFEFEPANFDLNHFLEYLKSINKLLIEYVWWKKLFHTKAIRDLNISNLKDYFKQNSYNLWKADEFYEQLFCEIICLIIDQCVSTSNLYYENWRSILPEDKNKILPEIKKERIYWDINKLLAKIERIFNSKKFKIMLIKVLKAS